MPAEEWTTAEHALRYLARADDYPRRVEGESALLEQLPGDARRVLDLGTGDGRLLGLVLHDHPGMVGVGLDFSEPMLRAAHKRFADDQRITRSGASMPSSPRSPSTTSSTSGSARSTARS